MYYVFYYYYYYYYFFGVPAYKAGKVTALNSALHVGVMLLYLLI